MQVRLAEILQQWCEENKTKWYVQYEESYLSADILFSDALYGYVDGHSVYYASIYDDHVQFLDDTTLNADDPEFFNKLESNLLEQEREC